MTATKQDRKTYNVRLMGREQLLANTDFHDLPMVAEDLSKEELKKWAEARNLAWKIQPSFLFGGYWKNSFNGDCYFPC